MSILIKGMEMPRNCAECPCRMIGYTKDHCNVLGKFIDFAVGSDGRREDCPLVEVPEDVQPVKWIPFSVRDLDEEEKAEHPELDCILDGELPEDGQRILVNVKFKGHESVQMDEFYSDCDISYLDSGYEIGTEVTHWMPLPEPPKDGET